MNFLCVVLFFTIALGIPAQASAQSGELTLIVLDRETGNPLVKANATVSDGAGALQGEGITDEKGEVTVTGLSNGPWTVSVTLDGYAPSLLESVEAGGQALEVSLTRFISTLDKMVVTASRTPETARDTPASISVVRREEIDQSTTFTPIDLTKTMTGMDFHSKGLTAHTYATRGARGVLSSVLMTLIDYRYAGGGPAGINFSYLFPLIGPDIERIELTRGPAAALYGLGSDRGVLHIITRSPFDSPGTNVSFAGGERSVFEGWLRHAAILNDKLAFKISGEYFQGDDWEYTDTLDVRSRDTDNQRGMGEAQVEWRPDRETTVILSGGHARAINNIETISIAGGMQFKDFGSTYFQGRLNHKRLFVNVMNNRYSSGESFFLRTGQPIVENSHLYAAQIQHGTDIGGRYKLLYGADILTTVPRTEGTFSGRFEDNDTSTRIGAYMNGKTFLTPKWDLVAAVRGEVNDRASGTAISPRIGVVFRPLSDQTFRVTYNRLGSLGEPSFQDYVAARLYGLDIRRLGMQKDGFTFSRDCSGGLCMRSKYDPSDPLPADATRTWAGLLQEFPELAGIPAPDGSEVETDLKMLQVTPPYPFVPVSPEDVKDIDMPESRTTTVLEGGYKGTIAERFTVGLDVYYTRIGNHFSEEKIATPNVFYDEETLRQYLMDSGMGADEAADVAARVAATPVGTISPEQAGASADLLTFVEQTDKTYSFWGSDLSVGASLNDKVFLDFTYSLLQDNIVIQDDVVVQILSVPENKAALGITYQDRHDRYHARAQARYVDAFRVQNNFYAGWVDSYTLLDVEASYRIQAFPSVRVFLNASNVFDHMHQEYIGVPEIGRLVVGRIQVDF